MWTVVYMASDENIINMICAILRENSIIFKCRAIKRVEEENGGACYEILVPDAEVYEAQELIFEAEIN